MARLKNYLWATTFNPYGEGRIHMDVFGAGFPAIINRRLAKMRRRQKMSVKQVLRWAKGITSAPTIVAAGTGVDYQAVNGLDVTLENDQDQTQIDFQVVASFSANPALVRFVVAVDGVVDPTQLVEVTWAVVTAALFSGSFAPLVGAGLHRYQLYMTATNAVTITLTAQQRQMRVATLLGA